MGGFVRSREAVCGTRLFAASARQDSDPGTG
jgi:hypothetical protein